MMWSSMVCRCGRPARGDAVTTPETGAVDHFCRQCSPEHCELDAYLRNLPGFVAKVPIHAEHPNPD